MEHQLHMQCEGACSIAWDRRIVCKYSKHDFFAVKRLASFNLNPPLASVYRHAQGSSSHVNQTAYELTHTLR